MPGTAACYRSQSCCMPAASLSLPYNLYAQFTQPAHSSWYSCHSQQPVPSTQQMRNNLKQTMAGEFLSLKKASGSRKGGDKGPQPSTQGTSCLLR